MTTRPEVSTPAALHEAGVRVRVLYRCHACTQGSHLVEVPATDEPGLFAQAVRAVVTHDHAVTSPHCPATSIKVKFVDPSPL